LCHGDMMFGFELVLDVSQTGDVINVHTSDYTRSGRHRQPKDSTKHRVSCRSRYSSFVVIGAGPAHPKVSVPSFMIASSACGSPRFASAGALVVACTRL
jgi:hypothetical protein